jgi:hypothetical protein
MMSKAQRVPPILVAALASLGVEGEAGSPDATVALPAEGGRLRRPPAGPALNRYRRFSRAG